MDGLLTMVSHTEDLQKVQVQCEQFLLLDNYGNVHRKHNQIHAREN